MVSGCVEDARTSVNMGSAPCDFSLAPERRHYRTISCLRGQPPCGFVVVHVANSTRERRGRPAPPIREVR